MRTCQVNWCKLYLPEMHDDFTSWQRRKQLKKARLGAISFPWMSNKLSFTNLRLHTEHNSVLFGEGVLLSTGDVTLSASQTPDGLGFGMTVGCQPNSVFTQTYVVFSSRWLVAKYSRRHPYVHVHIPHNTCTEYQQVLFGKL